MHLVVLYLQRRIVHDFDAICVHFDLVFELKPMQPHLSGAEQFGVHVDESVKGLAALEVEGLNTVQCSQVPSLDKSDFICSNCEWRVLENVDCSDLSVVPSQFANVEAVGPLERPNIRKILVRSSQENSEICCKDKGMS